MFSHARHFFSINCFTVRGLYNPGSRVESCLRCVSDLLLAGGILILFCLLQPVSLTSSSKATKLAQGSSATLFNQAIQGQVTDFSGNPIPDATIDLINSIPRKTVTDKMGWYSLSDVPLGSQTLVIKAIGFYPENLDFVVASNSPIRLDVGLRVGYTTPAPILDISGLVTDQTGVPVKEAKVTLVSVFNSRYFKVAYSDQEGTYSIKLSDPGKYVIYASKPGLDPEVAKIDTSGKRRANFLLRASIPK